MHNGIVSGPSDTTGKSLQVVLTTGPKRIDSRRSICRLEVNKTWRLMSTKTIKLIEDGEKGREGVWRWGKREIIYPSLHCHHQNDFCIKVGNDESHFNVS